jgi:hypothetical protein
MDEPLHLVALTPNMVALNTFAVRHNALPATGSDLGYAIHMAFKALFGAASPKPFRLRESSRGTPQLLTFSKHDEVALLEYAALQKVSVSNFAAAEAALGVDHMTVKTMPATWTPGRRYRFEVRV